MGNEAAAAALLEAFRGDENVRLPAALALAKIAPAQAVAPLVKLAIEDFAVAEEAVVALTWALQQAAAQIPPDDLLAVVRLQSGSAHDGNSKRSRLAGVLKTIDCSNVRALAASELARRGLAAQ